MSAAHASPSFSLEIEEIINLYRVCFESAVTFYRPKSLRAFNISNFKHESYPNANVWRVHQGSSTVGLDQLPSHMTKAQKKAYRKWNLCDTFCLLLHEPLKRHLERYGATVAWLVVKPRPQIFLVHGDVSPNLFEKYLTSLWHSALKVRMGPNKSWAFDGSVEQLGWDSSSWLLDLDDFWKQHAERKGWQFNDADVDAMRNEIFSQDNGYWRGIFRSFEEMLEGMDWEMLEKMSPVARVKHVRGEASKRASAAARMAWE